MKREATRRGSSRALFTCARLSCAIGFCALVGFTFLTVLVERSRAQGGGYERNFAESKATVESVLKDIPFALAGRLPVLDGFAVAGDHSLDTYQRGYFQSTVQVSATASGGSVVHVTTKVTAWYADPIPSRSGYRLLTSNGRLEADLLDELAGELGKKAAAREMDARVAAANTASAPLSSAPSSSISSPSATSSSAPTPSVAPSVAPPSIQNAEPSSSGRSTGQPQIGQPQLGQTQVSQSQAQGQPAETAPSTPMPRLPEEGGTLSSGLAQSLASQPGDNAPITQSPRVDAALKAEAESLEEILKNQSHPKNLVAVTKSGTPVVDAPSLKAKTLFLASAHDEFEMLDFNTDWVHVRISGLSRGWVWRNSLEMPEDIPQIDPKTETKPAAADLFHVVREETSTFPGDWAPLRGKSVKIFSVEKIDENEKNSESPAKLEFAKSVLERSYTDIAKNSATLGGVVLIFDSVDGGMLAVTLPVLQQWKAGTLSDAALWHQSFFDPPETFAGSAGTSASQ